MWQDVHHFVLLLTCFTCSVPGKIHIRRLDELIRACRRLGLDRLGSAADDEEIWQEQVSTPSSLPASVGGLWAADTLSKRERKLRNMGRALWCFTIAKDWVASRLSGACTIHPDSFNTTQPTPYLKGGGGVTEDDAMVWSFMMSSSYITHKYFQVCAEAQAVGKRVDYDKVLELDAEIMLELLRRPDWLQPEKQSEPDQSGHSKVRFEAILISCTLWHRMFALVRDNGS